MDLVSAKTSRRANKKSEWPGAGQEAFSPTPSPTFRGPRESTLGSTGDRVASSGTQKVALGLQVDSLGSRKVGLGVGKNEQARQQRI